MKLISAFPASSIPKIIWTKLLDTQQMYVKRHSAENTYKHI